MGMKRRTRSSEQTSKDIIKSPAFPLAGYKLFERLGVAVAASRGYSLSNVELARLMGQAASTAHYWFNVSPGPHVVSCFCLLEQLSRDERHRLVDALCRELPSLDNPRLAHDPVAVGAMKKLLAQPAGITLVAGNTAHVRTFVLNALGHTYCKVDRRHCTPIGLDVHEPDWFVPIETVAYLKNLLRPIQQQELVRAVWLQIRNSKTPLVLLNGVWSLVPELRKEIVVLASQRHVIVADQPLPNPTDLTRGAAHPVHILTVSAFSENSSRIKVEVNAI